MKTIYYTIVNESELLLFEDELCAKVANRVNNAYNREFDDSANRGKLEVDGEIAGTYTREMYIEKLKAEAKATMYGDSLKDGVRVLQGKEPSAPQWKTLIAEIED